MSATLHKLDTERDLHVADARALLLEAADKGFETVVVVGIVDGRTWTQRSKTANVLEFLGALELAKSETLKHWK